MKNAHFGWDGAVRKLPGYPVGERCLSLADTDATVAIFPECVQPDGATPRIRRTDVDPESLRNGDAIQGWPWVVEETLLVAELLMSAGGCKEDPCASQAGDTLRVHGESPIQIRCATPEAVFSGARASA